MLTTADFQAKQLHALHDGIAADESSSLLPQCNKTGRWSVTEATASMPLCANLIGT